VNKNAAQSSLYLLATSIAYLINADTRQTFEEKAQMLAALGKHVSSGELSEAQLHGVVNDAFNHAAEKSVDVFLAELSATLTPGQKVAVIINLYDVMLVDGTVAVGEKKLMQKFVNTFEIGRETMRVIREIIMIKNDTTIFTDISHPQNEPNFSLDLQMYSADEIANSAQLTDMLPGVKERWSGGDSD
jgi:uncharacterized tellurite resistance protein B-like protein